MATNHKINDGLKLTVLYPEGPSDTLTLQIVDCRNVSIVSIHMDANKSAEVISDLRKAFSEFTS